MHTDCIIIGAGAAGLAAAAALSRAGVHVTLCERLDRVGKKLLATGNGRCNLSNADLRADFYGEAAPFVSSVYSTTPPAEAAAFFDDLGLLTASEDGRIYPRTMAAASVLDVLRAACNPDYVTTLTGCRIVSVNPSRRGGWSVQTEDGQGLFAPAVLCAMGGSAAPQFGTDGSGYAMLNDLGHTIAKPLPALVQLKCSHPALRSLKGLRTHCCVTLYIDKKETAREDGELLFADYGVSGVCIFQLSRIAARAIDARRDVRLRVNLLPEIGGMHDFLTNRIAAHPEANAIALLTGALPRMLAQAAVKEANLPADMPASGFTDRQIAALASAISAFELPVTGTQGFANAQVTRGGVALDEVDPTTMASRLFDGLYIAGELLDVDGPCGGYNLHFAFASALTAAKAIRCQLCI